VSTAATVSTSTTATADSTTTTEPVATTSPSSVAGVVAAAWASGDDDSVRANAEANTARVLLALDPGDGPWRAGECAGTVRSIYCRFRSPRAELTLRVPHPGPTGSTSSSVGGASLAAADPAVALWPLTTAEEAENTQASVDKGHSSWHLEPRAVALSFAEAELEFHTPTVDAAASSGETMRVTDGDGRSVDIATTQPARSGPGGIWAVAAVLTTGV
jgi:hypothetical protein